ncbi:MULTISPECIES: hypothetical protein [Priestia]|uniref:hypothetical protein n=1 Tax=Priestia TaxID=2800373 RepID=UPI00203E4D4A|nr:MULTISPECIES: hypothetical protein [Priestia]MCM3771702.1 hypothetical protein [Priestia aryabhattai]MDY0939984.1 hypothetical protein [Priestia megaterium]
MDRKKAASVAGALVIAVGIWLFQSGKFKSEAQADKFTSTFLVDHEQTDNGFELFTSDTNQYMTWFPLQYVIHKSSYKSSEDESEVWTASTKENDSYNAGKITALFSKKKSKEAQNKMDAFQPDYMLKGKNATIYVKKQTRDGKYSIYHAYVNDDYSNRYIYYTFELKSNEQTNSTKQQYWVEKILLNTQFQKNSAE